MTSLNSARTIDLAMQKKIDELEGRLQAQLGGRIRDLNLLVRDDGLILRGFTRTYYAKQLAQHAVMGEVDLPIVANEIEVA